MRTIAERLWLKDQIRVYYPETYIKLYGMDSSVASESTHKAIKLEAKKLGIRHFNSMTRDELARAIDASNAGDQKTLDGLIESAAARFSKQREKYGLANRRVNA